MSGDFFLFVVDHFMKLPLESDKDVDNRHRAFVSCWSALKEKIEVIKLFGIINHNNNNTINNHFFVCYKIVTVIPGLESELGVERK